MDMTHYPQGEFTIAADERFEKGEWLRLISVPERLTVRRELGAPVREQFSREEMDVMGLLCRWQALTRGMLDALLRMQRSAAAGEELEPALGRLMRLRLCAAFRMAARDGSVSAPVYCMLPMGTGVYRQMTGENHYALDLMDHPSKIGAMLLANRTAMAFLNEGVVSGGVAVRRAYTERRVCHPDAIVRPTALFCMDDRNAFIEAVRRGEGWEDDFIAKAQRYALVAAHEETYPVLILCGEDAAHCARMAQLLEERGVQLCPLYLDAPDADGSGLLHRLYAMDGGLRRRVRFMRRKAA